MQKLRYVINSTHGLSSEKPSVETNNKKTKQNSISQRSIHYGEEVTKQHIFSFSSMYSEASQLQKSALYVKYIISLI